MDMVTKVMSRSMITNIFLSIMKVITGWIGKSGALIADGIHSFSDLSTDIVAVIGNHLSKKPADEKHPYGHGKIEYITSIMISIVILILGFTLIYESFQKEVVIPSLFVAVISFITIIVKYILSRYIILEGKKLKNNILLASGYESRTDVISSAIVFVSILLMQLSHFVPTFKYADLIATILVGIFIIKIGFEVLKENLSSILEEQETDEEYLNQLKNLILEQTEIHHIDHLMVLKYGSYYKLIAEVSVNPKLTLLKSHQYIHEAEHRLKNFDPKIMYVTIHINPDQDYKLIKASKEDLLKIESYGKEVGMKKIQKDVSYYFIVIENDTIGAFGYEYIDFDTIQVSLLYIEEAYRHCEIGTSIIQNLMKESEKKIQIMIDEKNVSALHFYKNLGFSIANERNKEIKLVWNR